MRGVRPLSLPHRRVTARWGKATQGASCSRPPRQEHFVPQDVAKETARKLLAESGWTNPAIDPIERLKLNGVLVERSAGARFVVAFTLDPVAEYLAADEHFEPGAGDAESLNKRAQVQERGEAAEGFLLALSLTVRSRNRPVG